MCLPNTEILITVTLEFIFILNNKNLVFDNEVKDFLYRTVLFDCFFANTLIITYLTQIND
jgi:hypothetical protein